jgi:Ca2+-binding RTX toxin-like protein
LSSAADYLQIENVILTNNVDFDVTGNDLDNRLTGNAKLNELNGGLGDDYLDGGLGDDLLRGGAGSDTYVLSGLGDTIDEEGNTDDGDTVQAAFNLNLNDAKYVDMENATVTGAAALTLTGNGGANVLIGNDGANTIDGGAGADDMAGGKGNDTYYVDDMNDVVVEGMNAGLDKIYASVDYSLAGDAEGVEELYLQGAALYGQGNGLANKITGTGNGDELYGEAGKDTLIGGNGDDYLSGDEDADTLIGGAGDDTYAVNLIASGSTVKFEDAVTESLNQGEDKIMVYSDVLSIATPATLVLGANIENLEVSEVDDLRLNLTGNGLINELTGNNADNVLLGMAGDDRLYGNEGNDTLDGGLGDDQMYGGDGDDIYVLNSVGDSAIEMVGEGDDTIRIAFGAANGQISLADDYENIENAELMNNVKFDLAGTSGDNVLKGNAQSNVLEGFEGNDTLIGGAGNDSLYGGADMGDGADILDGGTGADMMEGGRGDDTYYVDNVGDVVSDNMHGNDTIYTSLANYTLVDGIENGILIQGSAALKLTGNGLDNTLTGNSAANALDGGSGADDMIGGRGNDTYAVDDSGDTVTEDEAVGGTDTVVSSVSFTLGANVENLTLTGGSSIDGTGNTLKNILNGNAGSNVLDGGDGADTINGGGGDDTLIGGDGVDTLKGGLGNDVYQVNLIASGNLVKLEDVVTEAAAQGNDTLLLQGDLSAQSGTTTLVLGVNLENLDASLTGETKLNLTGNALANMLSGNDAGNALNGGIGNDTLYGGLGADTYIGGAGADTFAFDHADDGLTTIQDFGSGDTLTFDLSEFATLDGADDGIDAAMFLSGAGAVEATTAEQRLIYDNSTGFLYYDADGNGADEAAIHIATLNNKAALSATDFSTYSL